MRRDAKYNLNTRIDVTEKHFLHKRLEIESGPAS
jgi:hypothetical protein